MLQFKEQKGQSTTEYLIVLILVGVILGMGVPGSPSVVDMFLNAINTAFANFSSFISLPM